MKDDLEKEIKYWKLEKGLLKLYNYASDQAERINRIFKSAPVIESEKNQKSLETWKKLEPMTIDKIYQESTVKVIIDDDHELKKMKFKNYLVLGQFKKDTNVIQGVARRIFDSTLIQEGQFKNDDPCGYVRIIYQNGAYYEGMFSNFMRNGYGVSVTANGEKSKGLWKENDLVERY